MKRVFVALAPTLLLGIACAAHAQEVDCFPTCAAAPSDAPDSGGTTGLCRHRAVREALQVERDLAPVKKVVNAVTNPTGFVIEQINDHVVRIPAWVGYAMDPKGALRSAVMKRVRQEARKAAGIEKGCVADEEAPVEVDVNAQEPQNIVEEA